MPMKTRLHLKQGQSGANNLAAHYGDQLVCVRYRYDGGNKKRFKPIELIIEETSRVREDDPPSGRSMVAVRVRLQEVEQQNCKAK